MIYSTDKEKNRFAKSDLQFGVKPLSLENHTLFSINHKPDQLINRKIVGFGGAFTDATGFNVYKLKTELVKNFIKDYYGQDGLRYSMGRVPIGGSDFSTRPYTYNDIDEKSEDFELKHFHLQSEDLHFKVC